jgi:hypothetical protein
MIEWDKNETRVPKLGDHFSPLKSWLFILTFNVLNIYSPPLPVFIKDYVTHMPKRCVKFFVI